MLMNIKYLASEFIFLTFIFNISFFLSITYLILFVTYLIIYYATYLILLALITYLLTQAKCTVVTKIFKFVHLLALTPFTVIIYIEFYINHKIIVYLYTVLEFSEEAYFKLICPLKTSFTKLLPLFLVK